MLENQIRVLESEIRNLQAQGADTKAAFDLLAKLNSDFKRFSENSTYVDPTASRENIVINDGLFTPQEKGREREKQNEETLSFFPDSPFYTYILSWSAESALVTYFVFNNGYAPLWTGFGVATAWVIAHKLIDLARGKKFTRHWAGMMLMALIGHAFAFVIVQNDLSPWMYGLVHAGLHVVFMMSTYNPDSFVDSVIKNVSSQPTKIGLYQAMMNPAHVAKRNINTVYINNPNDMELLELAEEARQKKTSDLEKNTIAAVAPSMMKTVQRFYDSLRSADKAGQVAVVENMG